MSKFSALIALCAPFVLAACGASSPDDFIEKQVKYGCQHLDKCQTEVWEQAGFSSISDCVDKTLDTDLGGMTWRESFVSNCGNFDSGEARTCLAAARKHRSNCDQNEVNEPACNRVCGTAEQALSLELLNPADRETMLGVLEDMVAAEEAAELAAE